MQTQHYASLVFATLYFQNLQLVGVPCVFKVKYKKPRF